MEETSPILTEREIFDRTMGLPEGTDLTEFLRRSCAGDRGLEDRVAALVESSRESAHLFPDEPLGLRFGGENPGELIGNYRLEEIVGQGAFGTVWLAQQLQPVQRRVAIKILKLGLDTLAVISRFEAERQALAVMDHPNIANVHDAGVTATGRPYFVMDYLDGEPLFAFADTHRLPITDRLALMRQVVSAVHHAHQKGVIHRDLKSSNILVVEVDGKPAPKVIDFGIAKMISPASDAQLTLAPGSWGTPDFMSPEQLAGKPVDIRSDIFSLGVILYQLLSGSVAPRSPSENSPDITPSRNLMRLSQKDAKLAAGKRSTSTRQLAKELKGELDWIVMRAAAAEPEQRYSSADALNDDIAQFQAGLPVAAGPLSRRYIIWKFVRRHRGKLATAALAFVAMFAAMVVSVVYARQAQEAAVAMEDAFYEVRLTETRALRQSGRMGQRTRALAAAAAAAKIHPTAELRDEAIAAMALPDFEFVATLDVIPEAKPVRAYDFASDLLVVGSGGQPEIRRFRIKSGEELEPVPLPEHARESFKLRLSPGGEVIAIYSGRQGDVAFIEIASGRQICAVGEVNFQTVGCTFYDAARKVLVPMQAGGLREVDLKTGKEIRHIDTAGRVSRICLNQAETQILASQRDENMMQVVDAASGTIVRTIGTPTGHIGAAFSPDGRLVAYGDARGIVRCQSPAAPNAVTSEFTAHRALIHEVSFVLNGEFLLSSSWDNTARLWSPTGSQLMMLEGDALVSPDGKRLLLEKGKRVQLLKMIQPAEVTGFSQPVATKVPQMAFSADRSLVAICSDAGTMVASFPEAKVLASVGSRHHGAFFDPDGGSLITSGDDGLRVWDLFALRGEATSSTKHVLQRHSTILDQRARGVLARSADGAWLATTTPASNSRVRVIERATGTAVADLPWHGASVISLLFDPGGRWMAASYWRGSGFSVWDTKDWQPLANPAKEVGSLQLSVNHDGSLIASASPSEVCLWDTSTWQCLRRFPCEPSSSLPYPVDFSPDGSILAHGYAPTRVRLVRVSDGDLIATLTLPAHDEMRRVKFSPDQRSLGVSSETRSYFFDLGRIRNHLGSLGLEMWMP